MTKALYDHLIEYARLKAVRYPWVLDTIAFLKSHRRHIQKVYGQYWLPEVSDAGT